MAKLFCIAPHVGRVISIDRETTPFVGASTIGFSGDWGVYLIGGSVTQLTAIAALPEVCPICVVTEDSTQHWDELNGVIPSAIRTKMNTWLTAHSYPTIPAGWKYDAIVRFIGRRMRADFDLDQNDIMDA
jgi:hypothetical protein